MTRDSQSLSAAGETPMSDQSQWPAYLRDDAPYKTCDTCGRKSWSPETRIGTSCGMPQPSGPACEGHFVREREYQCMCAEGFPERCPCNTEVERLRSCLRQEQDLSNDMHAEIERLRDEHDRFVNELTDALAALGVPAHSTWLAAVKYLAEHGGRG